MVDITTFADGEVVAAIYKSYEDRYGHEEQRGYLGASVIGTECKRALWYAFRWATRKVGVSAPPSHDGRLLRLFQTGHLEEPRMINDLRCIGAEVYDVDPSSMKQFRFTGCYGHMAGNMDGCGTNIPGGGQKWHVLEFKTHSSKSFAQLKKSGVEKSKPVHHAQMTWYMGKSGMDRSLYLAKNKDTDELYSERIKHDPVLFEKLEAKGEQIVFAQEPPSRISEDPKFYLCNWCDHKSTCFEHKVSPVSCRTCCFATPEKTGDAAWSCNLKGAETPSIPIEVQRTGCSDHLHLPSLVTFAEPVDAGNDWIMYRRKDNGKHFVVVGLTGMPPVELIEKYGNPALYNSMELSAVKDNSLICDPVVDEFKQVASAKIVG